MTHTGLVTFFKLSSHSTPPRKTAQSTCVALAKHALLTLMTFAKVRLSEERQIPARITELPQILDADIAEEPPSSAMTVVTRSVLDRRRVHDMASEGQWIEMRCIWWLGGV